jgi:hypothetical protein
LELEKLRYHLSYTNKYLITNIDLQLNIYLMNRIVILKKVKIILFLCIKMI